MPEGSWGWGGGAILGNGIPHDPLYRVVPSEFMGYRRFRRLLPFGVRRSSLVAGRSLSESGHNTSFCENDMSSFELELISAISSPKGGNRVSSIRIRAQYLFLQKPHVFSYIRAYLLRIKPEGGETERPLSES